VTDRSLLRVLGCDDASFIAFDGLEVPAHYSEGPPFRRSAIPVSLGLGYVRNSGPESDWIIIRVLGVCWRQVCLV